MLDQVQFWFFWSLDDHHLEEGLWLFVLVFFELGAQLLGQDLEWLFWAFLQVSGSNNFQGSQSLEGHLWIWYTFWMLVVLMANVRKHNLPADGAGLGFVLAFLEAWGFSVPFRFMFGAACSGPPRVAVTRYG